mmetsp:Transcript_117996/g.286263  ORF Transcript_117996/g.286263 Transcript_117996/m.286263 type:complete len:153 (-) Transcript_117996:66-524(-)
MLFCDWSLGHVNKLSISDMSAGRLSRSTRRWGFIAKTFPFLSRCVFHLAGVATIAGAAFAFRLCPPSTDPAWEDSHCSAPWGKGPPNPQRDLEVAAGFWLFVGLLGMCTSMTRSEVPWLHEPLPGDEEQQSFRSCRGCLRTCLHRSTRIFHP